MNVLKRISGRPYALLALLIVVSAGTGVAFVRESYVVALLYAVLIAVIAARLVHLYGESMRRVNFLLDAIRNNDLNFRFSEKSVGGDERPLNIALNRIREIVVEAKLRAEERERYYQLIMECARTGLLTVDAAGSVYQVNGEALRIFGLQRMTHIRQVQRAYPEACSVLAAIQPGERRHVKCSAESGEVNLSLDCSEIQLDRRPLRVISVSDIDDYLSAVQIESWSKLTRILTRAGAGYDLRYKPSSDGLCRDVPPLYPYS